MLLDTETTWQAVSAAVLASARGYPDTVLFEGAFLADAHCAGTASQFDAADGTLEDEDTKAHVALGTVRGREGCVEVSSDHAVTLFYRNQACRHGRAAHEEYITQKPTAFRPRCLVLLLEAASRAALRDELLQAGRVLLNPVRIQVNYTTGLSPDPAHAVASSSCAYGNLLKELHAADTVGQEKRDRVTAAQAAYEDAVKAHEDYEKWYKALPAVPPPDASLVQTRTDRASAVTDARAEVTAAVADVDLRCVPSTTTTCGRSSLRAPNPWISADGTPCIGHSTGETLAGFFCAYWSSDVSDACNSQHPPPCSLAPCPRVRRKTPTPQTRPRRRNCYPTMPRRGAIPKTTPSSSARSRPSGRSDRESTRLRCVPYTHPPCLHCHTRDSRVRRSGLESTGRTARATCSGSTSWTTSRRPRRSAGS